jgi:DNA-binding Lrp family transcriptional regulator
MMQKLDDIDRKLISRLCGDIGDSLTPYKDVAEELGLSEEEVISRITSYRENGMLRRFGAILKHQTAGFKANGMSVWNVPAEDVQRVGEELAACPEITHCYERQAFSDWPYNVYGMIHGKSKEDVLEVMHRIADETGIKDCDVLFSVREFKKTSVVYFANS